MLLLLNSVNSNTNQLDGCSFRPIPELCTGAIDLQAKTSGSEMVCGFMISPDFYTHMSCSGELLL